MPDNSHDSSEEITSPQRIGQLMKELKESHTLLRITVPGHKGSYTSAILNVDTRKGQLLLDELNPPLGHKLIQENRGFRATTQLNRVQLRFKGEITAIGEDNGVAFYQSPLPSTLLYAQNRQFFRSSTRITNRPKIVLTSSGGTTISGLVTDISIGGVGALLPSEYLLEQGSHFPECRIYLSSGNEILCASFVRHTQASEKNSRQQVGIQFTGLKASDERTIQRYVADLQRETLKR